jgi:hypothetical protein
LLFWMHATVRLRRHLSRTPDIRPFTGMKAIFVPTKLPMA